MIEEIIMMEWPKKVRTVNWADGILTLDNTKNIEVSELTVELMEDRCCSRAIKWLGTYRIIVKLRRVS